MAHVKSRSRWRTTLANDYNLQPMAKNASRQTPTGLSPRGIWFFRAYKRYEMELVRDVSREEIAEKLGIHAQTVGDYLRGDEPVPDKIVFRMTGLLATVVDEFPPAP